jgi:hypothetical protein
LPFSSLSTATITCFTPSDQNLEVVDHFEAGGTDFRVPPVEGQRPGVVAFAGPSERARNAWLRAIYPLAGGCRSDFQHLAQPDNAPSASFAE